MGLKRSFLLLVILLNARCHAGAISSDSSRASCTTDSDCKKSYWSEPYQTCVNGLCQCPSDNPCVHVTSSHSGAFATYYQFCGKCNDLGAECSGQSDCPVYTECSSNSNGYCVCRSENAARLIYDMCRIDDITHIVTGSTVGMTMILIAILILNKAIASQRMRQCLRRCRRRRSNSRSDPETQIIGDDGVYFNPQSNSKTASYTIQNSEFISTSEDPDLDWAMELSLQEMRERANRTSTSSSSQESQPSPASDTVETPETRNSESENLSSYQIPREVEPSETDSTNTTSNSSQTLKSPNSNGQNRDPSNDSASSSTVELNQSDPTSCCQSVSQESSEGSSISETRNDDSLTNQEEGSECVDITDSSMSSPLSTKRRTSKRIRLVYKRNFSSECSEIETNQSD